MILAKNVVVHDPETDLAKIDSQRMQDHGWPKAAADFVGEGRPIPSVPDVEVLEAIVRESLANAAESPASAGSPKQGE